MIWPTATFNTNASDPGCNVQPRYPMVLGGVSPVYMMDAKVDESNGNIVICARSGNHGTIKHVMYHSTYA